MSILTYQLHNS